MVSSVSTASSYTPSNARVSVEVQKNLASIITDKTDKYSDDQKLEAYQSLMGGKVLDGTIAEKKESLDAVWASDFFKKLTAIQKKASDIAGAVHNKAASDPNYNAGILETAAFYRDLSDPFERKVLNADQIFEGLMVEAGLSQITANQTVRQAQESVDAVVAGGKGSDAYKRALGIGQELFQKYRGVGAVQDIVSLSVAARSVRV